MKIKNLPSQQAAKARRFAFQFIYQSEASSAMLLNESSLKEFLATRVEEDDQVKGAIEEFVQLVHEHVDEIDDLIRLQLKVGWKLERIARVDLAILRVGVTEAKFHPELSKNILMSEAAKMGAEVGTERSKAFVHGVLNAIAQKLTSESAP